MEVICAAAGKPRTKLTQVPYDRWPFKFKKACRRHKPKIEVQSPVMSGDVWTVKSRATAPAPLRPPMGSRRRWFEPFRPLGSQPAALVRDNR